MNWPENPNDVDLDLVCIESWNNGNWVITGPDGHFEYEPGEYIFKDRVKCLETLEAYLGCQVIMGHEFNDLDNGGGYWHTVRKRNSPRPPPPYIPPTLSLNIEGLLIDGSPVVDTAESAQYGYRGLVLDRPGGLRVLWDVPDHNDEGEKFRYYITSITGGSGLDLSLRAGRNRAVDWMAERLGLPNLMPTSPLFGALGEGRWRLTVFPGVDIDFVPAPEATDANATFVAPGLAKLPNMNSTDPETFADGTFVGDGLAIKAIVEWMADTDLTSMVRTALGGMIEA